jgi:hypothetical protein
MASLIARRKRVVDGAFDPVCLSADSVDDRMTVAPELGIFRFISLDKLQRVQSGMVLERFAKQTVKAFGAVLAVYAVFDRL